MVIIWVSLAAFSGGIVSAVLGWLDSHEAFNPRKFMASVLRALAAGVAFAITYAIIGATLTIVDLAIAFVAGAGVDASVNRIAGAIKTRE